MSGFGWANIANDLLFLLVERGIGVATFIRLSAVCKSWNLVASATNCCKPVPWLMLIETKGSNLRDFYDHSTGEVYQFPLPQARGIKHLGFAHGWLITCDEDACFHLLNPFTGVQITLPNGADHIKDTSPFTPSGIRDSLTVKATCSPIGPNGDGIVALTYKGITDFLFSYCRPTDKEWITLENLGPNEVAYINGIFYTVTNNGEICSFDLLTQKLTRIANMPEEVVYNNASDTCISYIVDCGGEILIAIKIYKYLDHLESDSYLEEFRVFKLDTKRKRVVDMKDIGDFTLFLGTNNSISIKTSSYGKVFEKNCIYFSEFLFEDEIDVSDHFNIYNLEDKTIRTHVVGLSKSRYSFPLWVTLDLDLCK